MANFSRDIRQKVFNKGKTIRGKDPALRRKDKFGDEIYWAAYGNTNSKYGWDIDHIKSIHKGGTNKLNNLQPLHWKNNRKKGSS